MTEPLSWTSSAERRSIATMAARPSVEGAQAERVDVVIVTAVSGEWDAVKAVTLGAIGTWLPAPLSDLWLRVERRTFRAVGGGELSVTLLFTEGTGGERAAAATATAVSRLKPQCIAMCGVAAGKPIDTKLGDVVIADCVFLHDAGKCKEGGLDREPGAIPLPGKWLTKVNAFAQDPGEALAWLERDAWTPEQQRAWLLDLFSYFSRRYDPAKPESNFNSTTHRELLEECCPDRQNTTLVRELVAEGLVQSGPDPLTARVPRYQRKTLAVEIRHRPLLRARPSHAAQRHRHLVPHFRSGGHTPLRGSRRDGQDAPLHRGGQAHARKGLARRLLPATRKAQKARPALCGQPPRPRRRRLRREPGQAR